MLKKLIRYVKIEFLFIKMNLLTMMQFNVSYFLSILYEIAELSTSILYFAIIFQYVSTIAGWSKEAVIFLTIYAYFVDVTCTLFFIGMVSIPDYIRTGIMDLYLLKPIDKQFFLTFRRPNSVQIIGFFGSVLYFIYYIIFNDIQYLKIIGFLVSMICSVICMYSILLIIVSLSFWVVRIGDMWNLAYIINGMGAKPLEIYPKVIKSLMIFIIPSAIIITFPVGILFGVYANGSTISIIITLIFFMISRIIFKKGLKNYDSACG